MSKARTIRAIAQSFMSDPVLIEVLRGAVVESRHRGAVAIVDAEGRTVLAVGNVMRPVFPRSAIKALQALPLLESGAADRFGLGDDGLALACASHSGEEGHVGGVRHMLSAAGLSPSALVCGAHWPISQPAAFALARTGAAPGALHNNCSGKHAGFLCTACVMGAEPAGYQLPDHPVQQRVRQVLEDLTGATLTAEHRAIDGCSVPTWAIPLQKLALGFARFGSGHGLTRSRQAAAARLRAACARHPWYVAGTGRFCTEIMNLFGARAFVKTGAEGVFCGAFPDQGLGFAVKCDDGAGRAAEAITAVLIARFVASAPDEREALQRFLSPVLRNWNGIEVGVLRPTAALLH